MFSNIKDSPNYRWYIFAAVSIGTFMATLDGSVVNVALPSISGNLHAGLSEVQWVVTAYLLAISSLLPIWGRVADLLGRKKIYSAGFMVFTLGSALCGLAPNIWFLVGMRVLQAVGASMMMSNSFAIVTATFPPGERGKAMGLTGTVVALGSLTGPAIGGLLVGLAGWRSIFYINLPIGVLGYLIAQITLPSDHSTKKQEQFDFLGAALFSLGMVAMLLGINNGEAWGWSSTPLLVTLTFGIAVLGLFFLTESRVPYPMIDISLFKIRPYLLGNISGLLSFVSMFCNNILLPFYLQQILGYSPSRVGLIMMAYPLTLAIVAPISGNASDKINPLILATGGLTIAGIGLFYMSTLTSGITFWQVIPGPIIMAMGAGMFQSPNNNSVMSSVPPPKLGVAGGITALVRNVGMVVGIALAVSLFEALGGVAHPSIAQIPAFMHAFRYVMLTAMGIAFTGALVSLSRKGYQGAQHSNQANPNKA